MTAPLGPQGQYATAKPYTQNLGGDSSNLSGSPDDLERLRSYALYEDMYFNRPETFKVFLRGKNNSPIYVPSAKKIIEAMNRFLCKGFQVVVPSRGNETAEAELDMRMKNLFKREELYAKFANQKRFGMIRGDAMWYITADPNKEQFSRISIHELNPGNYFAIKDPADSKRTIGCHIVEVIRDPREKDDRTKTIARRRTYLRGGTSFNQTTAQYEQPTPQPGIWTEVTHWEIGKWDDRNMKKDDLKQVTDATIPDVAMFQLPAQINSLPVYHWQNVRMETGYGLSEISGIETLITGINQGLSDADLTMVLQGLGVYATDAKPPVDSQGNPTAWSLGPGGVVEVPSGKFFNRVSGVGSVQPALDLVQEFKNDAQESNGIPDIAAGKVDVAVAESGISLSLQLAPIIASSGEKEIEILGTMDHMLYDLMTMWFPAYEATTFAEGLEIVSNVDDPMPVNREARVQEVLLLFTSQLIGIAEARAELTKLGYKFTGTPEQVLKDAIALSRAASGEDSRYAQETEPTNRTPSPEASELPGGSLGGQSAPAGGTTQTVTV